jgi:hypothetical protein
VNFIDEEQGATSISRLNGGGADSFSDIRDGALNTAELNETALCATGDYPGQTGFPGPRGAIKDHGSEPVRLNRAPQELTLAKKMTLADILLQRAGSHPRCQWRIGGKEGLFSRSGADEKIIHQPTMQSAYLAGKATTSVPC